MIQVEDRGRQGVIWVIWDRRLTSFCSVEHGKSDRKNACRVIDIGGYSDVGPKDIIQFGKSYTMASATLY